MINLIANKDHQMKNQIEFLLGKKVPLTTTEINSMAHLTIGNMWIVKVLEKLNLSINDIIYERDRDVLKAEIAKNK